MANLKYILIILLLACGCKKKTIKPEDNYYWGETSALKNGEAWTSRFHITNNTFNKNNLSILFHVYNLYEEWRESLGIYNVPINSNLNNIYNVKNEFGNQLIGSTYTTLCCDGDVVEDRYIILEDGENNFIQLTSIDEDEKEYKGIFQVTLVRDPNDEVTNPLLPDTIRFTEGKFHGKILE